MGRTVSAIKDLRKQLDLSQKDFATRLGVSLRALISYENGERTPTNPMLIQLMKAADLAGSPELATAFQQAVEKDLGHPVMRFKPSLKVELMKGEEEHVSALLSILRDQGSMYRDLRTRWNELSEPVKAKMRAQDYHASAVSGLVQTINQGLADGLTDEQIMHGVPGANPELVKTLVDSWRKLAEVTRKSRK